MKNFIINETKERFTKLLPGIDNDKLSEAIKACYKEGITSKNLTRNVYAYMYPKKEPCLYKK